jgi:hypothetical protein
MNSGETNFEGCVANGQQIPSILVPGLYDIAIATTMDKCDSGQGCRKMPVIYYNPVMKTYSMDIREFFYFHECAHHILNHVIGNYDKNSEQAADCWAIREMKEKNQLTQNGITSIKSMLQSFGQGDFYHLPGMQRAQNLDTCLSAPDFAKQ